MQKCDLLYLNLSFIEQHYSEDISIEDISSFCGLNRSYFSKVFRDTMGESPQGFLLHYRMARAAQLLTESRLPISTISAMVSYPNQLHFSRAFKNVYGISPRDYRAKHLALKKLVSFSTVRLSFFRHIKTPHLSDRILSDKWGVVHSGAHPVFFYYASSFSTRSIRYPTPT